jgi:hypothetical protein
MNCVFSTATIEAKGQRGLHATAVGASAAAIT